MNMSKRRVIFIQDFYCLFSGLYFRKGDRFGYRMIKKRYFYLPHENRGRRKGNCMTLVISRLQEFV